MHKTAAAVAAGPAEDACDLSSGSPACVVLTGGDCSLLATHINGKHLQAASRGDEVRGMACQLECHSYSNSSFTGKWQEVKPDRACCCSLKAGYIIHKQAGQPMIWTVLLEVDRQRGPREVSFSHFCLVPKQGVHIGHLVQAPQLDRAVKGAGEQLVSVLPEGQAGDDVPVGVASCEGLHIALRARVPDVDLVVSPSKSKVPAAGLLSGLVTLMMPDQVGALHSADLVLGA